MTSNLYSLLASDPLINYLYRRVRSAAEIDDSLSENIAEYLLKYLAAEGLSGRAAYQIYERFVKAFNQDIENFSETGKYPVQIDNKQRNLSRKEYDIVLMLSCLASPHRYEMMKQLVELSGSHSAAKSDRNALFVGCGPGLEIELLRGHFNEIDAFDISLGDHLPELLPSINLRQEYFPPKGSTKKYDDIYLIEILEHLEDPVPLLRDCKNALTRSGRLYLTTATNIPQFDHYYNFPSDHKAFETQMNSLGLVVKSQSILEHNYFTHEIGAKNHLYVVSLDFGETSNLDSSGQLND